jgi:hypothetical protein
MCSAAIRVVAILVAEQKGAVSLFHEFLPGSELFLIPDARHVPSSRADVRCALSHLAARKRLRQQRLARSGRTDEQDVRLGELDVVMLGLSTLPRALEGEAGKLLFATNAGMFDPALKPVAAELPRGHFNQNQNVSENFNSTTIDQTPRQ